MCVCVCVCGRVWAVYTHTYLALLPRLMSANTSFTLLTSVSANPTTYVHTGGIRQYIEHTITAIHGHTHSHRGHAHPSHLTCTCCFPSSHTSASSRAPHCPPPGANSWNALLVGLCAAHEGQHGLLQCPGRLAGGIGTYLVHQIRQACMAAHALPRMWHTNSSGKQTTSHAMN